MITLTYQLPHSAMVLIVDNHADSGAAAARALSYDGHSARAVANHVDALEFARNCRVDLLIADIGTAGSSGEELLSDIRALYPIGSIAVTGWGDGETYARRGRSEFDRWLFKPVSTDDLLTVVAEVLLHGKPKPCVLPNPVNYGLKGALCDWPDVEDLAELT